VSYRIITLSPVSNKIRLLGPTSNRNSLLRPVSNRRTALCGPTYLQLAGGETDVTGDRRSGKYPGLEGNGGAAVHKGTASLDSDTDQVIQIDCTN